MLRRSRNSVIASMIFGVLLCTAVFSARSWAESLTTVGLVQLQSADVGNFAKMRTLVRQAKAQNASLVIFPEDSVFGWLNPEVFFKAAPIPGRYSDEIVAIAKEENVWLATGLSERGPKAGPGAQEGAHQVYDSAILVSPEGRIVLHHRQVGVVRNAFLPEACKRILNQDQCSYLPGNISDIKTVDTVFGRTAILVCADAFTYSSEVLDALKLQKPDFVIVPWGITASAENQCGTDGFDATGYASKAAAYLKTAFVVGANGIGPRIYGRFLPSVYCGTSGYATPTGQSAETPNPHREPNQRF